jgi:hypothetical protein
MIRVKGHPAVAGSWPETLPPLFQGLENWAGIFPSLGKPSASDVGGALAGFWSAQQLTTKH